MSSIAPMIELIFSELLLISCIASFNSSILAFPAVRVEAERFEILTASSASFLLEAIIVFNSFICSATTDTCPAWCVHAVASLSAASASCPAPQLISPEASWIVVTVCFISSVILLKASRIN